MIGGSEYKGSVAKSNDDSNEKLDKKAAMKEAGKAVIRAVKSEDPTMLSEALHAHWKASSIEESDEGKE